MQWVICLLSIFSNVIVYHVFPIACGVDRYPRNMPCRNAFSCHKLATRKGCNKKFTQVLPSWCWQKLSNWDRRQLVKNYCKRSCKNCLGKWLICLSDYTHLYIIYITYIHNIYTCIFVGRRQTEGWNDSDLNSETVSNDMHLEPHRRGNVTFLFKQLNMISIHGFILC